MGDQPEGMHFNQGKSIEGSKGIKHSDPGGCGKG